MKAFGVLLFVLFCLLLSRRGNCKHEITKFPSTAHDGAGVDIKIKVGYWAWLPAGIFNFCRTDPVWEFYRANLLFFVFYSK